MKHRITKIKVKKGVYTLGWEIFQEATNSFDSYALACEDLPREELNTCLQALAPHVVAICELDVRDTEKITVQGITLSYKSERVKYLTITAQKALLTSGAPLLLNTPARANAGEAPEFCMSEELIKALDALMEEAWRYINGDRAQTALDFEQKEPA